MGERNGRQAGRAQCGSRVNLNFNYALSSKFDFQHSLTLKSISLSPTLLLWLLWAHSRTSVSLWHKHYKHLPNIQYRNWWYSVFREVKKICKLPFHLRRRWCVYFHFSRYTSNFIPSFVPFDVVHVAALNNKHIKIPMHKLLHELFYRILRFWLVRWISSIERSAAHFSKSFSFGVIYRNLHQKTAAAREAREYSTH